MTEITELQTRIDAALDRIAGGLEGLSAGPAAAAQDPEAIARLEQALDEERTANAQLEERLNTIRKQQDGTLEVLAGEVDRLRALLASEEEAVARLTQVNADLRTNNAALREAVANGLAEPHLVDASMMAELEALRAVQRADRIELDAVLGELGAMVADAARAGEAKQEMGDA
ncbi:MAG: hypothetical protein CSA74_08360 [Rhodobacterales bacterium]|nr:MAG: hypothetical protein CSA74_08360 [Rhodobacterales bacterium]